MKKQQGIMNLLLNIIERHMKLINQEIAKKPRVMHMLHMDILPGRENMRLKHPSTMPIQTKKSRMSQVRVNNLYLITIL
ncbi:MAG TPA: hypothetical protein VEV16_10170 [Daejeonella sp.]|nr:hypothetical protein [Daejeonella sp.]